MSGKKYQDFFLGSFADVFRSVLRSSSLLAALQSFLQGYVYWSRGSSHLAGSALSSAILVQQ
jgi:hypothetical protein